MKKFFIRIGYSIYLFIVNLFWGMRKVDDEIFTQFDNSSASGIGTEKEKHSTSVAGALLRGEVTQQVRELRYRTYKVDRESKKYKYLTPTLALRREKFDTKFIAYENADNLDVVIVQPNDIYKTNLAEIEMDKIEGNEKETKIHGAHLDKPKNLIKIERSNDFVPRYRIEDYTKRIVVRRKNPEICVVDFYVSKYPDNTKYKTKGFVKEIEKLIIDPRKNDINDIRKVSFTSYKAFGSEDLCEFEYDRLNFIGIVEYDGMYLLRYEARPTIDGKDLVMTEYFDQTMEDKYARKEKKELVINPFEIHERRIYTCGDCGKEIKYDTEHMENLIPKQARFADEENDDEDDDATEYMDAQISKVTYGKYLCKDCLRKYIEKQERNA